MYSVHQSDQQQSQPDILVFVSTFMYGTVYSTVYNVVYIRLYSKVLGIFQGLLCSLFLGGLGGCFPRNRSAYPGTLNYYILIYSTLYSTV